MATVTIDRELEYLAIPYSHEDESVMQWRAEVSDFIFSKLSNQGRKIYAPISSCHHVAKKYGMPRNWEFWEALDREFIKVCKRIVVIQLEGWETSTGVKAELKLAEQYGVEIEFLDPYEYLKEM